MNRQSSIFFSRRWLSGLLLACFAMAPMLVSADEALARNRVSFSISAQAEVANDTLVATLFHEASGDNIAALSDEVNKRIQWALQQAKQVPEVKAVTRDYSTQPVYQKGERIDAWRVRQTIQLTTTDAGALAKLLSILQQRLAMESMGYTVSDAAREQTQTSLIGEAVKKFRERAELIASSMQRPGYAVVRMDFDDTGRPIVRRFQQAEVAMMRSSAAPPAIEAGEQTVTVSIRAEIELEPAH